MNTYEVSIFDGKYKYNYTAKTPSKAKYQCFIDMQETFDLEFMDAISQMKVKLLHKFKISDLFSTLSEFNHMKEYRGMKFIYMGMKVEVDGKCGVIVGSNSSANLNVCFDGDYKYYNCHPFWRVKYYLKSGDIIHYEEV